MKKFEKLSRAEMKNILGGKVISYPCSYYLCNIDGSHGTCPDTCACGPLTVINGSEYMPCVNPGS